MRHQVTEVIVVQLLSLSVIKELRSSTHYSEVSYDFTVLPSTIIIEIKLRNTVNSELVGEVMIESRRYIYTDALVDNSVGR